MARLTPLLTFMVFVLFSCKRDHTVCDPAPLPSLSDFIFRIVDKNTGEELLVPGKLNPDSVTVSQPCNNSASVPLRHYEGYLTNEQNLLSTIDSSKVVYTFAIDSLRICEYAYIHWSSSDIDTLRLQVVGDGCDQPQVTTITFNNEIVPLSQNRVTWHGGYRQYYLLKK